MIESEMTFYSYLMCQAMITTECGWATAAEAATSTVMAHPEWDTDERRTWTEWEALERDRIFRQGESAAGPGERLEADGGPGVQAGR